MGAEAAPPPPVVAMAETVSPVPVSLQTILTLLQEGELEIQGRFVSSSNYTFYALVSRGEQKTFTVYKPTRGERPLWDFPEETLALREVAAFLVSEALGWGIVPPTIFRPEGPYGAGSLQLFIQAETDTHYFNLTEADKPALRQIALFDLLINNADRKGGHLLKDLAGKLWVIDHGICFHAEPKLRTVIWDFAGETLDDRLLEDVAQFHTRLTREPDLKTAINSLLSPVEVAALRRRAAALLAERCYPGPKPGERNFPWPPV
jgi:uncharacterized repeat protein (TIGR03843 family)